MRSGLAAPYRSGSTSFSDDVALAVPGLPLLALACLNALDTDSPSFDRWERLARDARDAAGTFEASMGTARRSLFSSIRTP
jgi:hypothetical protein